MCETMQIIENTITYTVLKTRTLSGYWVYRFKNFNTEASERKIGPAVLFEKNNKIKQTFWKKKNKLHRTNGPAVLKLNPLVMEWHLDGKPYTPSAHEYVLWQKSSQNATCIDQIEIQFAELTQKITPQWIQTHRQSYRQP